MGYYGPRKLSITNHAADPTANDDISAGYRVGDRWVNTVANEAYVCVDNSIGAAVWEHTTLAAGAPHADIVVAASDSLAKIKETADYVCDGTADDVQLQAALDALPSIGGTIRLTEGTFYFASQVSRAIDNVRFLGSGAATKIEWNGGSWQPAISRGTQAGWTFEGIHFDNGGPGQKQGNAVRITNCFEGGAPIIPMPANPRLRFVSTVADAGYRGGHDVRVKDNIAFMPCYRDDTLVSIDISDPTNPVVLDHLTDGTQLNGIHDIIIDGDYAYVTNIVRHSIASIDISDPSNMSVADEVVGGAYQELSAVHALCKHGNYIFAGANAYARYCIIDATDPTNMTMRGILTCNGEGYPRGVCPIDGDYIAVVTQSRGVFFIANCVDKDNISIEGQVNLVVDDTIPSNELISVRVRGDYAYCGGTGGFFVVDITNKAAPSLVGSIPCGMGYFEIYDDFVIASDAGCAAMVILDISTPASPRIVDGLRDTTNFERITGLWKYGNYVFVADRDTNDEGLHILEIGSGKAQCDTYRNLAVNTANKIVNTEDISGKSAGDTATIAAQMDCPRNITIAVTDGDTSITSMVLWAKGWDAKGNYVTEMFDIGNDGLSLTGDVAFARIDKIEYEQITGNGAGDVLSVGTGSKLGISGCIGVAGDVYKVARNDADDDISALTVDAQYGTVDVSGGGAINANDDFSFFYKTFSGFSN